MSRIGRQPIALPKGVTASVQGQTVTVQGTKGKLEKVFPPHVTVSVKDGELTVSVPAEQLTNKAAKAAFGTSRALLKNMVIGVSDGWKRSLELNGVGFNAKLAGSTLTLAVGFSHEVDFEVPKMVVCKVGKTNIDLESIDKQALGTFASRIRKTQPAEPYLGKGIKYTDETIRRKAGKAAKKA